MGSNAEKVDLNVLNFCIQNYPNFVNLPVTCEVEHLRAHYHDPWKRKDDPEAIKVVVMYTSIEETIFKEVVSQAKSVFNAKHNTHLRPLGLGWTALEWEATRKTKNIPFGERTYLEGLKHRHVMELKNTSTCGVFLTLVSSPPGCIEVDNNFLK